jgi:hypothetical protein
VLIFVNSFSFIFLEFLAKIYWANFFSWAESAKKGRYTRDGTGPDPAAGWAGRPGPVRSAQWGPGGGSLGFSPIRSFSTSFFGQKILREV